MSSKTISFSQKHNFSQVFWNTIENEELLTLTLKDLSADRNVNVGIDVFFSIFPVYKLMENKRRAVEEELAATKDCTKRKMLIDKREKFAQEEKQARINILLTAHSFSGMKYTPLLQDVADLFFSGEALGAYKKLNSEKLVSTQEQILALIKTDVSLVKTRDNLENNANEFRVKAQLTTLNIEIENPEERFQKCLFYFNRGKESANLTRKISFYVEYIFDFAHSISNFNAIKYSILLYQEILKIIKDIIFEDLHKLHFFTNIYVLSLNNLAVCYTHYGNIQQSTLLFQEAIYFMDNLALIRPDTYSRGGGLLFNNIGFMYLSNNEFEISKFFLDKALIVRENLSQKNNSNANLSDEAETLNNLATLHHKIGDFDKAISFYNAAIRLFRHLVVEDKPLYIGQMADSLNKLSISLIHITNYEIALKLLSEALEIFKELSNINPHKYISDLIAVLQNLGLLHVNIGNYEKSFEILLEAKNYLNSFADDSDENCLSKHALVLHNLSLGYLGIDNYDFALSCMEESLENRKRLAKLNPKKHTPELASTYANLSLIFTYLKKEKDKSLYFIDEATKLVIELNVEFEVPLKEKILKIEDYVKNYWNNKLFDSSDLQFEIPMQIIRKGEFKFDKFSLIDAAKTIATIRKYIEDGKFEKVLTMAEAFVKSYEKLDEKEKEEDYDFLAEAKMLLGICYGKRAGTLISIPEEKYLTEAYELSKQLLLSGDDLVLGLYIECAYQKIESLKKELKGWFPSKKVKAKVAEIRTEVFKFTQGKSIPEAVRFFYEAIDKSG